MTVATSQSAVGTDLGDIIHKSVSRGGETQVTVATSHLAVGRDPGDSSISH